VGSDGSFGKYAGGMPRDPGGLAEWRRRVLLAARDSAGMRGDLWGMCSEDPLFWALGFVWTYDPRRIKCPVVPFALYGMQERVLRELDEVLGHQDSALDKCRDVGASWLTMTIITHRWHFRARQTFLVASAKEDLVDRAKDPDCLFWKIDFILEHEPAFLRPSYERKELNFFNAETLSTIDGCSTTGDLSRGGRRTAVILDEFATVKEGFAVLKATQRATNCRIFNSTHKGTGTAFYAVTQNPDIRKIEIDWWEHPEWRRGLYRSVPAGRDPSTNLVIYELEILDPGYNFPPDYPFILDGKKRSPWYDHECRRAAHPSEVAQEIDRNPQGSDSQFFDGMSLKQQEEAFTRDPMCCAELEYNADTMEASYLDTSPAGRLRLWCLPVADGRLPEDSYAISADISAGTGASNSVLMIGSKRMKTKIGEFASPNMDPHEFARFAVSLARWLGDAYLIWEANGPGRIFGNVVLESGYRNIYWKRDETGLKKKVSDFPGFYSTGPSKLVLLGEYRRALIDKEFHQPSKESIEEAAEYVFTSDGDIRHSRSRSAIDPSGAKDNHGDRVIGDALLWKVIAGRSVQLPVDKGMPSNCYEARRRKWTMLQRQETFW